MKRTVDHMHVCVFLSYAITRHQKEENEDLVNIFLEDVYSIK